MPRHFISASLLIVLALTVPALPALAGVEAILGKWLTKAETPNGPLEMELDLKLNGNELVGTLGTFQGAIPLANLKFQEPDLTVEATLGGATFKLTGVLKDGKFTGKWMQVGADVSGTWSAERRPGATLAAAPSTSGISGAWTSVSVTPNGDLTMTLELKQEGDKLAGTLGSEMGTIPIKAAAFKDNKVQFDVEFGGNTYRVEGTLKENKFTGQWSTVGGTDTGAWSATRKTAAPAPVASATGVSVAGDWNSVAVTPDGKLAIPMNLKETDGKLTGTFTGPEGSVPLQKATLVNNVLTFEVEVGGNVYRVQATLTGGKFTGKWSAVHGTDTGEWSAERKTP